MGASLSELIQEYVGNNVTDECMSDVNILKIQILKLCSEQNLKIRIFKMFTSAVQADTMDPSLT